MPTFFTTIEPNKVPAPPLLTREAPPPYATTTTTAPAGDNEGDPQALVLLERARTRAYGLVTLITALAASVCWSAAEYVQEMIVDLVCFLHKYFDGFSYYVRRRYYGASFLEYIVGLTVIVGCMLAMRLLVKNRWSYGRTMDCCVRDILGLALIIATLAQLNDNTQFFILNLRPFLFIYAIVLAIISIFQALLFRMFPSDMFRWIRYLFTILLIVLLSCIEQSYPASRVLYSTHTLLHVRLILPIGLFLLVMSVEYGLDYNLRKHIHKVQSELNRGRRPHLPSAWVVAVYELYLGGDLCPSPTRPTIEAVLIA